MKRVVRLLFIFLLLFGSTLMIIKIAQSSSEKVLLDDELLIIAHRGASGYAPEHTMEAYRLAVEMGADYIEVDLRMSSDGVLVAMHDEKVDRTTNGEGLINTYTIDELKELDAGTWFNLENPEKANDSYTQAEIPTMKEILEEFGDRVNYYIETKDPENNLDMEDKLMDLLEQYNLLQRDLKKGKVVIQSFNKDSLLKFDAEYPELPLVQLLGLSDPPMISDVEIAEIKSYAIGIGANYDRLNQELIDTVKDADLLIHPYTLNNKEDFEQLKEWGVDGVFTNYVDIDLESFVN